MGGVVKSIDPGRGPVSAGLDPEIAAVEAEEAAAAASVTGGGQGIANDPVDSEPCHFYYFGIWCARTLFEEISLKQ